MAKVYKMNDYEWWASNLSPKETLAYYLKETGEDDTYPVDQIKECDLDKEGMYIPLEDSEKISKLEKLGVTKQIVENKHGHSYGFGTVNKYEGDWYIKVPFRQALEYIGFNEHSEPVGMASTES